MLESELAKSLTPGAQRLVEAAGAEQQAAQHAQLGLHHWLLALLARHGPMAEALASGLNAASLQARLREQVTHGEGGTVLAPPDAVERAVERARARGKQQATERDLAAVLLSADGYTLLQPAAPPSKASASAPDVSVPHAAADRGGVPETAPAGDGLADAAAPAYRPRAQQPTPALEHFARDLTREAAENKLPPLVGRAEEIQLVIETLCRRTKRNPVLVGPAGCGKTALVEGLALRIVQGQVPALLRNVRLLALQPSALVAGSGVMGELDKRMQAVIQEASQDGVILFIDEVHSIVGAGGREGSSDIASQLKPALARGAIACIAATTDDEYRRCIEPDGALERRFQPVRVQELTPEQTLGVLRVLRDELARLRGVQVAEEVLQRMVDFAGRFLRNRTFPDKAVDLLEQSVAYALTQDRTAVAVADAEQVAQRLVGMPLDVGTRLATLRQRLAEGALLSAEDIETLLHRLEVTLRGLDVRAARPNAVLLLLNAAAAGSEALAATVAEALFGAADRVVTIDFSRFTQPHDVSVLLGAPPGYVGYSDTLPLHRVAQMPWCVLRAENVHACHPAVRDVLVQALEEGLITESRGKRIYLSDTVVLLTAEVAAAAGRSLGFRPPAAAEQPPALEMPTERAVQEALGAELAAQCDLVCAGIAATGEQRRRWLEQHCLADLAGRFRKHELHVQWDESLVTWLLSRCADDGNQREWERLVDEEISPRLVAHLPDAGPDAGPPVEKRLRVKWDGGTICVEVNPAERS